MEANKKKNKKKIIFIVAALIIVLVGIIGVGYFITVMNYRSTVEGITIRDIDLATIPDGVYHGSSEQTFISAFVEVTVQDHGITHIELDHRHDRGEDAEVISEKVIEKQTLQVDTVTGATYSSKIILQAIEDALISAVE